jgi:glycosyltransferase involved in cell wall biosynthesis
MPSYNHEKYVSVAIESVLEQTVRDLELIIIDDCSKDGSKELIASYLKKDSRVKAFFHETNLGIAKTLNQGLREARGKFVAFLASDDIWLASKLEMQLNDLRECENLLVWSEGEIIDANGCSTGQYFTEMYEVSNKRLSGNIFNELLSGNFIFGSSLIFKKENISGIWYDEELKYLNDFRFILDLAWKYESRFCNKPLAKYRLHGKNAIFSNFNKWALEDILVRERILRDYKKQVSKKAKANILAKIGRSYLSLGEKNLGRVFLFKATILDPRDVSIVANFVIALVGSESYVGSLLNRRLNNNKLQRQHVG